jgi:hypothetical protein
MLRVRTGVGGNPGKLCLLIGGEMNFQIPRIWSLLFSVNLAGGHARDGLNC